jgi:netrin 1
MKQTVLLFTILLVSNSCKCYKSDENDSNDDEDNNIRYKPSNNQKYQDYDPCYDRLTGKAQRCIPNFENIAYGKKVIASSTCGSPSPMNYCIQSSTLNKISSSLSSSSKYCDKCDANIDSSIRDTRYLTDLEETNTTCWVSGPVYEPTDTSNLSLQISFNKKYELTYISMQFCTQLKPDSLSIMKSMDYGKTWVPFQYYSSDCKKVFNKQLKAKITQANEQEAICTDQHLQSSPFNTNRIGFSTLEGRPSFHEFDTSPVLQDWVTATDIKIVFNRLLSPVLYHNLKQNLLESNMNSYINNNNSSTSSLKSKKHAHHHRHSRSQFQQFQNYGYFFASLSEIAVGGRCKCNGHASKCGLNK